MYRSEAMTSPNFDQWRESGRYFEHHGHRVFYQEGGNGEAEQTLVCIHGFPSASWDWHRIWPRLCERFGRVIALDMLGFGYSAKPKDYRYSLMDQTDLHESLLRYLKVSRFHILAHDYGVSVAQELLARHEDRKARCDEQFAIDSCVLLNGGLFPEAHRARPIQKLLDSPLGPLVSLLNSEAKFRRNFSAVFGKDTQPSDRELREFWRLNTHNGGHRLFHKLIGYIRERREHRERWVGALRTTDVPMRLINGPDDPVSGAHMAELYRKLVSRPDIVSLVGIGHYPQVEDPDGVLNAFLEFYDSMGRSRSLRSRSGQPEISIPA